MGVSVPASRGDTGSGFNPTLVPVVAGLVGGRVRLGVSAASLTTFAVGGDIDAVVTVESPEELRAVTSLLHRERQSMAVFGFGSNLLVADEGLRCWVVRLGANFREVERISENEYHIGGASSLMSVSRRLSDEGLSGLEFAAGIPASVGGAVFMNAGAHGAEMCTIVERISAVMPDGSSHEWRGRDLLWRYRSSGLPSGCVVTSVYVRLAVGNREQIARRCGENLAHRRITQPLSLPSAGSFFKNPSADLPAGRLLEQAGLKGSSVGGAFVSNMHANWLVNPERTATCSDIVELMARCISQVQQHSGILLHPEVKVLGAEG